MAPSEGWSGWGWRGTACVALLCAACGGSVGNSASDDGAGGTSKAGAGGTMAMGGPQGGAGGTPEVVDAESCDPSRPVSFGDTPLRRLSRTQYAHTVRDLLGPVLGAKAATLGAELAAKLPPDERVGPFEANPTAAIADAHARTYLAAAGELAAAATDPMALPKLLPCKPSGATDTACAERFFRAFGLRTFRRPPSDEAVTALLSLWSSGTKAPGATDPFASGIRLALEAMLASPDFVYHFEAKAAATGATSALDPHETASRLAYFLWDTMPDEALFAAAGTGRLTTPEGLRAEAERMLADPRARDAMDTFATAWLGIDGIETITRDPKMHPLFRAEVAAAMKKESLDVFDHLVRGTKGTLTNLLTDTTSIVPPQLLRVYGATRPLFQNPALPIELPKDQRAGVLTHASVLAATSHMDHTSPVKRGVFLLDNVLCHEIPLPQGLEIPPLPEPDPNKTTRQRFAQHEAEPACAACHAVIDPLGFALERYDAVGAYRDKEGTIAIDDSGTLKLADAELDGTVRGAVELGAKLARSSKVRACLTKQVRRFALGRHEEPADACTLARLDERFAATGGTLRELLLAVVTDESFRNRPVGK